MAKESKSRRKFPYRFILPVFVYLALMTIFPVVFLIFASLLDYNLYGSIFSAKFVGASNYLVLFGDPEFWNALRVTLVYTLMCVIAELVLALGLAMIVLRIRFQRVITFIIIIPMVITPAVVAWHWRFMYNDIFGLITYIVERLTGTPIAFLASTRWALPALVVVDVWQWTPFVFLILLAGLLALPHEPYEAGLLDGASGWQMFRYITLPLLRPAITIAVILRTVDAFRDFDKFFIMTEGGPASSTNILGLFNYIMIFSSMHVGKGAALSLIMLFIGFGLARLFITLVVPTSREKLS